MVLVPHLDARLLDRRRRGETCVGDDDVHSAVLEDGPEVSTGHLALVGHVRPRRDAGLRQALSDLPGAFFVEITGDDTRPLGSQGPCYGAAYTSSPSCDEGDPTRELSGWRGLGELVELKGPVLYRVGLLFGQGDVASESVGPAHDVYGPIGEVPRECGLLGVVGRSDEPDAGDHDDPRVGVEHRRVALRVSLSVARVVGLVPPAVSLYALAQLRLQFVCAFPLRVEVDPEGSDLRPHQVVGAGR